MSSTVWKLLKSITVIIVGTALPAILPGLALGLIFRGAFWECVYVITPLVFIFAVMDGVLTRIAHRYDDFMTKCRLFGQKQRLTSKDWLRLICYGWTSTDRKRVSWGPWYWTYYSDYWVQQRVNHPKKHH